MNENNEVLESVYGPADDFGKVKVPQEIQDKIREMDLLIAKTFNSTAGKKVLKFLRDETIEKPVFRRIGQDIAAVNEGYFREGQNELVRQLEGRIKRASNPS